MIMWLQALGLVCGLGAAAFATAASKRRDESGIALVVFLAMMAWSGFDRVPPFGTVGLVAACGAAARLFRPGWVGPAGVAAGVLSAVWITLLLNQGLPLVFVVLIGAGVPISAVVLARTHARFAPESLLEEALLVVGALGLVVASGPTIADGLHTARSINVPYAARSQSLPAGFVIATILAATAGGGYTLWWRNR